MIPKSSSRISPWLLLVVRWVTALLIVKVGFSIVSNYIDYFPPNFDSDFLQDRRESFYGLYRIAFYIHILSSPITLLVGLLLLNHRFRQRLPAWHRLTGRVQGILVLSCVVPSGIIMSYNSFAGPIAGWSFVASGLLTAMCIGMGWRSALDQDYGKHERWMLRSYVLLCSAVVLRLMGGLTIIMGSDAILSYRITSWASWMVPAGVLEFYFLVKQQRRLGR